MGRYLISILAVFVCITYLSAQENTDALVDHIQAVLIMDSITIQASKSTLHSKDFIKRTIEDSSFYIAFQNLRNSEYVFESQLKFFNKKEKLKAQYFSLRKNEIKDGFRKNAILSEKVEGKYSNSKGEPKYYTAKLYEQLFFTSQPTNIDTSRNKSVLSSQSDSKMSEYITELKKLIFLPGRPIDVPFTGDKFSIFDEDVQNLYQYLLYTDTLDSGEKVFTFHIIPKEDVNQRKISIQSLKTYFNATDYQIMGRELILKDNTLLYEYDVTMQISITRYQNNYYPSQINYKGKWNIPLKTPEICDFYFNIVSF